MARARRVHVAREPGRWAVAARTGAKGTAALVPLRPRGYQAGVQHAEHFLSRLDRLPRSEVDLALELYRDPDLLRAVLDAATLPDRAERVAISIDDPAQSPFLVVTRSGHFVTCLGRGMRAGDLPVVARAELDAISRKVARLREKMAVAKELGRERGHARLLRRLLVSSDSVSREDFLAVAAWEPLLGPAFLDLYLAMGRELSLQGPVLRSRRGRRAQDEEVLHTYWNLLHAAGHMALLGAITADRDQYVSLTEQHAGSRAAFSYPLTGTGVIAFILKGAWAAARLGKLMLPDYKRALAEDVSFFELLDTLFALLAIGTRAKNTRAEIVKALHAAPSTSRDGDALDDHPRRRNDAAHARRRSRDPSTTMGYVRERRVAGGSPRRSFPALTRVVAAHRTGSPLGRQTAEIIQQKASPAGFGQTCTSGKHGPLAFPLALASVA